MQTAQEIKEIVKEKYGQIVTLAESSCCSSKGCGCSNEAVSFSEDYSKLPGYCADADFNLGCGIPTQFAAIREGNTVLDLGSGAGNDVFVARRIVGETGKVIGVDMTEAMIEKARANQQKLGVKNVEFRFGEIEHLPVANEDVDVVISNCVLNLVPDKAQAFREMFRALKPGGHFVVSDIVLRGELPESLKNFAALYAGCVSGAMQQDDYLEAIRRAGFVDVEVKTSRAMALSDEMVNGWGNEAQLVKELAEFRAAGHAALSITVFGRKPASA